MVRLVVKSSASWWSFSMLVMRVLHDSGRAVLDEAAERQRWRQFAERALDSSEGALLPAFPLGARCHMACSLLTRTSQHKAFVRQLVLL